MVCPPILHHVIVHTRSHRKYRGSGRKCQAKFRGLGQRTYALDKSPMAESESLRSTLPAVSTILQISQELHTLIIASPCSPVRCSGRGGLLKLAARSVASPVSGGPLDSIMRQLMARKRLFKKQRTRHGLQERSLTRLY
jgi:hypothetical protein